MYVIQNAETLQYVAMPGAGRTYTRDLTKARTFLTYERAVASGVCENEMIVLVATLLQAPI